MVKENTYIHIEAFMVNELKLKGNELLVYAIIYGFSQDGKSCFSGSLQYLADWTNSTKRGIIKVLKSLQGKGLINKKEIFKNNIKFCEYSAQGGEQSSLGYGTEFIGGSEQSSPNTILNTIDNTINRQTCAGANHPTPEDVFNFYITNKLPISPERFWRYNNKRKWKDKEGKPIKNWQRSYLEMCEGSLTLDEKFEPDLKFNKSNYDFYTGE